MDLCNRSIQRGMGVSGTLAGATSSLPEAAKDQCLDLILDGLIERARELKEVAGQRSLSDLFLPCRRGLGILECGMEEGPFSRAFKDRS